MNCDYCQKLCKSFASKRQHEIRCRSNLNRIQIPTSRVVIDPTKCSYCNKIYTIKTALSNHETRCPQNQNRSMQQLTIAGLKRLSIAGKNNGVWDQARRQKHSIAMKKAVTNNPNSYTSSNRGRTKQIEYNGIKFQGKWELDFYKWAEQNSIHAERNVIGFPYEWNGLRTYFPDFYLPSIGAYVEIKGYETSRDVAKWTQFAHPLIILRQSEIEKIKKNQFILLTAYILDATIYK